MFGEWMLLTKRQNEHTSNSRAKAIHEKNGTSFSRMAAFNQPSFALHGGCWQRFFGSCCTLPSNIYPHSCNSTISSCVGHKPFAAVAVLLRQTVLVMLGYATVSYEVL